MLRASGRLASPPDVAANRENHRGCVLAGYSLAYLCERHYPTCVRRRVAVTKASALFCHCTLEFLKASVSGVPDLRSTIRSRKCDTLTILGKSLGSVWPSVIGSLNRSGVDKVG